MNTSGTNARFYYKLTTYLIKNLNKGFKQLFKSILILFFCIGIMQSLMAQEVPKTYKNKKVVKKAKIVKAKTAKTKNLSKTAITDQVQFQMNEQIIYTEMLDGDLLVSQKFVRTLHDNAIYVDERGVNKMTFDIIKKNDGNFALAYAATNDNLDNFNKGLLFTLATDLSQIGTPLIITRSNEELRQLQLNEFYHGGLSIAYTCNENSYLNSAGRPDSRLTALKFVSIDANGQANSRNIDGAVGNIELKGMFNPPDISDIIVAYNFDEKGKLGQADMYLGTSYMTCTLQQLSMVETKYYGQSSPKIDQSIKSISLVGDKFLILSNQQLKTPIWDIETNGLTSGRLEKSVWPLLLVDRFAISNSSNSIVRYDNDPYTAYSDGTLQIQNITESIPLSDGGLVLIEQDGINTFLNIFDAQLNRRYPHVSLATNIHMPSLQYSEIGNNRILFFYKTKSGSDIMECRVAIYDWNTNQLIKDGSEILWQNNEDSRFDIHRLVRVNDNIFYAVTLAHESGTRTNTQTLEYRILTLNLEQ